MRPGGEKRGSSRDRLARRRWLLATFDPEIGPDYANCRLLISDRCLGVVDIVTLTVDRIEPGGSYAHTNIQPACAPCQNLQGALITRERRSEWKFWKAEADALGEEFV